MPNNPIQIVVNDKDYLREPEGGGGGPPHDFFAGRDSEFTSHKAKIHAQVSRLSATLSSSPYGPALYGRVRLREEALAKSHRPDGTLFKPDRFPCVGAGEIGELFYLIHQRMLPDLAASIEKAELTTTWKKDKEGKDYAHPSVERSEVGAILDIDFTPPDAKRKFDAQAALQWLSDKRTGGGYIIELYEYGVAERDSFGRPELFKSLASVLRQLGPGAQTRVLAFSGRTHALQLRLTASPEPALIWGAKDVAEGKRFEPAQINLDDARHQQVLTKLAEHPLVRRILLPLRLELSEGDNSSQGIPSAKSLVVRDEENAYPRVGVIDSGVGAALNGWTIHRHDFLDVDEVDAAHGTFVSGLLVAAQSLNGPEIGREADGCELVDIALFPKDDFDTRYPGGFVDFLEEVEQAVDEAVEKHDIRVFNMSINATGPVDADKYGYYAQRIDEISRKHDIIFVNSCGNLAYHECRAPWPKKTTAALDYFASRAAPDTIAQPTESVTSISVGAINPPNVKGHIAGAPTTYTRRGPGLRVGCKPDVAHFGGAAPVSPPNNHGLISLAPDGSTTTDAGTSFAAPLVAKTLASLDHLVEGRLPSHVLRALLLHHCGHPEALKSKRLSHLARQFVGFGVPSNAQRMLETNDSSITMVFNSRLPWDGKRPMILRFPFTWPQSLVDSTTGACFGYARMTLVYDSPLDPAFGAEFVRVNLDAKLQQRQPRFRKDGQPSYSSVINQCFLPKTSGQPAYERELVKQGLKWWPNKRYEKFLSEDGLGSSSEWRLEVSSLTRAEARFPATGIPFALILTIADPDEQKPIFQEIRRNLQARNVNLSDIRMSAQIRSRGRG